MEESAKSLRCRALAASHANGARARPGVGNWDHLSREDPMSEMVYEKAVPLADEDGRRFDLIRVYAEEMPGGTWQGWIEFRSAEGESLTTERETTQSNREGVAYWATGLEPIFLEGALSRASAAAREGR
jgi:hypothetical protein